MGRFFTRQLSVGVGGLILMLSPAFAGSSFSCFGSHAQVETALCSKSELARLAAVLSRAYARKRRGSSKGQHVSSKAQETTPFDTTQLGQGGTLLSEENEALFEKSAALKRDVEEMAAKLNVKPDAIRCSGMRFPGSWEALGGERVAPYTCHVGDKWLHVRMKVVIMGRGSKAYTSPTPEAMREAFRVKETQPTWEWSDKEPDEP